MARFSSRFSLSSSLIRSRSPVVRPSRRPMSRSACLTQRRRVSDVQPNFSEIDSIAAHCELYSSSCSSTIRTARSRTSGEYLFDVFMTPSSHTLGSPAIPGRFSPDPHSLPLSHRPTRPLRPGGSLQARPSRQLTPAIVPSTRNPWSCNELCKIRDKTVLVSASRALADRTQFRQA